MATPLKDLEIRLDKQINRSVKGAWAVVVILVGWLGIGTTYLLSMHGDIQAIKQSLKDNGLGEIVAKLQSPKSPAQLQAALTLTTGQLQTARAEGKKPDAKKLNKLAGAIAGVIYQNRDLPEAWQAASTLVSYRSDQSEPPQANCFGQHAVTMLGGRLTEQKTGIVAGYAPDVLEYSNCTFLLADVQGFTNSFSGRELQEKGNGPSSPVVISLMNVHLVYHGGALIPFTTLECKACTYDFDFSTPPPLPAQKLTHDLLVANNSANIKVEENGGM